MLPPTTGDQWFGLTQESLPIGAVYEWVVRPDCGAVVLFSGTVRNHAEGRDGVEHLEYEAYDEVVLGRFSDIAAEARRQWPVIGRVALLHRVGRLDVGESAVVAAVSAPHRSEAFEAARFAIDTLKAAVPIWKHETWSAGSAWGADAQPVADTITNVTTATNTTATNTTATNMTTATNVSSASDNVDRSGWRPPADVAGKTVGSS